MILRRVYSASLLLALVAASVRAAEPTAEPTSPLGGKVVAYCQEHKGQQVGDGECSSLAGHALRAAGARMRGRDNPGKGDYTWGELALVIEAGKTKPTFSDGKPTDVRPGDIIQFRDVRFEHRAAHRYSFQTYHHHTAVVQATEDGGMVIKVLQENVGGDKIVKDGSMNLNNLKEGWMRIYHPIPARNRD